jgi:segregation and condensation protein B
MARSRDQQSAAESATEAASLGIHAFIEPDDQGISLDELSQAYAALLGKGADPYADGQAEGPAAQEQKASPLDLLPDPEAPPNADAAFEITPRGILEAILFVGHPIGEPLTSERIAALMRGVRPAEIDDLVAELNAEYQAAGAPYTIVSVGPGYQLALRPEHASLRDSFYGRIREARLSQAAVDILAIIAYHQPVTAEVIDRLRGKPSGAILSQLLRRDLISLERSPEAKSKPAYRTTTRFLEIFGLDGLADLPQSQENSR